MVTIRCRSAKVLQMARTVRSVTSMIVVIARRDSGGQEQDPAVRVVRDGRDERRRGVRAPFAELPSWHEHEEDD